MAINDPILYYNCDSADTSGSTITDRGSGGNNGTLVNSPGSTTGHIKQAITLNGTSQYIDTNSKPLNSLTNVTISLWVYMTASSTSRYGLMGFGGDSESSFLELDAPGFTTNNRLFFRGSSNQSWTGFANPLVLNTWTMVTIVRTTSTITLYKNGSSLASTSLAGAAITNVTLANFRWGQVFSGTSATTNYIPANVDECRIYNRALSSSEVTDLYNYTGSILFRRGQNLRVGSRSAA